MATVPSATPAMIRHEAMRVASSSTAPARQASAEVSPSEPGSRPTNAFHHDQCRSTSGCALVRSWPSSVAPEKPSTVVPGGTAVQTLSPVIAAG